jgi:FdhD protein
MKEFKIIKIRGQEKETIFDPVAVEISLTIMIGVEELVVLLCSPKNVEDLVRGFLFTSGIINSIDDIINVIVNRQQWNVSVELDDSVQVNSENFRKVYSSGCGKGLFLYNTSASTSYHNNNSNFKINSSAIINLMNQFQQQSEVFLKTGGVHSAAIADYEKVIVFREDIGRHNAVDKVIGCSLVKRIDLSDKIMLTSGRISSEIILKMQKIQIPVIVSRSAPTNQAIQHARNSAIALVGFVRGNRMNVYSNDSRIQIHS